MFDNICILNNDFFRNCFGEVSGDIEIVSENPFAAEVTDGELVYEIPENVSEIKSAYAVVNSYSGNGNPTYGFTTNISLTAGNTTEVLEYANLTFVNNTANDPAVYQITDFTSKQYSDYQTLVDITDNIKGLSAGDSITISVNNTELTDYNFDGRIKLIALIFAYDDYDNEKISYWLNIGQAWTKGTLSTIFNTKDFDDYCDDVTLEAISLSSSDAKSYELNGKALTDPIQEKGNYFIFDVWNITDNFEPGEDTNFTYTSSNASTYASYKSVIQLLKINTPEKYSISATIAPEYKYDTAVYAGVENTLKITVNNGNRDFNGSVKLFIEDEEIASGNLSIGAGESAEIELIDTTIRPINETTVNGANNTLVDYILNIVDADGGVLNSTNVSYKVLYDGYLAKDKEYPGPNVGLREISFTGDYFYLITDAYSVAGDTNRTDEYDVDLMGGTVNTALLYVPYNWDKVVEGDFKTWNTTFNNQIISPIASYRDQSNLGGYGKYGYGLVVYDVTDLVVDGINTFEFNKTAGNVAVYPTNLIIFTNNDESTFKTAYISEEADLLSTDYNKNVAPSFNTPFNVTDGNATLYVFAASAQSGEGNLMVNGKEYTDVWNGTSQSLEMFMTDADVISDEINVYFEATGSTILGLHQMVVVESDFVSVINDLKPEYSGTVYAGVENNLTLTVTNEASKLENATVDVLVDGDKLESYDIDSLATAESKIIAVIDPTIRPVTAQTVNGNDNEKVNYTVIIKDADGNIIDETNYTFVVLYNGYLGKDFEYPKAEPNLREITVTGDVIVLTTEEYSASSATNRTDVFEVDLENGTVNTALLYVSYNWDKVLDSDYNSWNTTFNGQTIAPMASYRDQSNLGTTYAKYGYGLVVYDVTAFVVDGVNTFELNKTAGNSAVYPSNLIVLTDKDDATTLKTVYIYEEADLLSKSYNKNLDAGFNTSFIVVDGNATLFIFAASAQSGEGNLYINGENYTDVWNGTSSSLEMFVADVNGTDIAVYFEATGATILGLHQMVIVEQENILLIQAPDVEKYYNGTERFVVTVTNFQGNPVVNQSVNITINGRTYTKNTDENGTASIALGLNSGVYNVTTAIDNNTFVDSVVTILSTVNGTDVVKMYGNATQYYATFLDSEGKYLADGTVVKFNINGVMYERKVSGNKGLAKLNINLPAGEYVITAMNPVTGEKAANNITVLSIITENNDITKFYRNATQYTVKIIGEDGNVVGAGELVTFNVNGVFYTRETDEFGIAKLNINLPPGDYVITAEYKECKVSNDIKVLNVLTADDISMKYQDGTQFVATLVDGQGKPYAQQTIRFNINGVFYNKVTDSFGQAKLNINLLPGEYIITSSYNGLNTANKITITA
ncbi:DUF3344 domain-containing protein [uncultured Methanobrevibacter sp.]|uniref:DUF3344 domain-containing protein n=1 Tax=uncultured Methanobrevibacter sp. TaxID=253161 RepID=UPI003182F1CC